MGQALSSSVFSMPKTCEKRIVKASCGTLVLAPDSAGGSAMLPLLRTPNLDCGSIATGPHPWPAWLSCVAPEHHHRPPAQRVERRVDVRRRTAGALQGEAQHPLR